MTLTTSPRDTGEIQRPDLGETTELGSYYRPEWPPVLRRPEALEMSKADTEIFDRIPTTIGVVDLEGPQKPPPPLPKPAYVDGGVAQPIAPLERVASASDPQVQLLRKSVPYVPPAELRLPGGRHRKPSTLDRLVAWVGALLGGAR